MSSLENRLASATEELEAERRNRAIEKLQMQDSYESLRGRIVRRLEEELLLLQAGLHALRRHPPKVAVMDDHADRVIEGLTREIEHLRKSEKCQAEPKRQNR